MRHVPDLVMTAKCFFLGYVFVPTVSEVLGLGKLASPLLFLSHNKDSFVKTINFEVKHSACREDSNLYRTNKLR